MKKIYDVDLINARLISQYKDMADLIVNPFEY